MVGPWIIILIVAGLFVCFVLFGIRNDGEEEAPFDRWCRALSARFRRAPRPKPAPRPRQPPGNEEEKDLDAMAMAGLLDVNTYMFRQHEAKRHKQIIAVLLLLCAIGAALAVVLYTRGATADPAKTCRYVEETTGSSVYVHDTVTGHTWRRHPNGALTPVWPSAYGTP